MGGAIEKRKRKSAIIQSLSRPTNQSISHLLNYQPISPSLLSSLFLSLTQSVSKILSQGLSTRLRTCMALFLLVNVKNSTRAGSGFPRCFAALNPLQSRLGRYSSSVARLPFVQTTGFTDHCNIVFLYHWCLLVRGEGGGAGNLTIIYK